MNQYLVLISRTALFQDFTVDEIQRSLRCLKGYVKSFGKGDLVLPPAQQGKLLGIILEGTACLRKTTYDGDEIFFTELREGNLIGETTLWNEIVENDFDIQATNACKVLFIEKNNILHPDQTTCSLRQRIVENLFHIILVNNQTLYQKISLHVQKNLRERILHYLELQARKNNLRKFTISFSRNELASYLRADRSALSRELSKMKAAGLINFKGSTFELLG